MRVVLDTNIVVAAVRSRTGASAKLLELLPVAAYSIALSAPLALEYEKVLVRELVPAFASLVDVDTVIRFLCDVSEKYDPGRGIEPMTTDPDDDFLLELAIEAKVDYIVTHNTRHLASVPGIQAITPGRFLELLRRYP